MCREQEQEQKKKWCNTTQQHEKQEQNKAKYTHLVDFWSLGPRGPLALEDVCGRPEVAPLVDGLAWDLAAAAHPCWDAENLAAVGQAHPQLDRGVVWDGGRAVGKVGNRHFPVAVHVPRANVLCRVPVIEGADQCYMRRRRGPLHQADPAARHGEAKPPVAVGKVHQPALVLIQRLHELVVRIIPLCGGFFFVVVNLLRVCV